MSNERFAQRHLGPNSEEQGRMLSLLGYQSLDELVDHAIPSQIRTKAPSKLPMARTEESALKRMAEYASENQVARSYLGMGYYDCIVPPVILRNVLENPAWYTAYTPYQAEVAQGRLEACGAVGHRRRSSVGRSATPHVARPRPAPDDRGSRLRSRDQTACGTPW